MKINHLVAVGSLLGVGALVAAVGPERSPEVASSCTTVLESQVCTWVVTEAGVPTEFGATVPMAVVEAVSTDVEMVWPPRSMATVPFPPEAREALGIDHLGLNWEAHGHPPASFATPHFDFHFYTVSPDRVREIDCADESKPLQLPAGYALPDIEVPGMGRFVGLCVPAMGMHAMPAGEVDETAPFSASMMLGYYGGAPVFFEPMVSRELLLSRRDFGLPMPAVGELTEGIRYPRTFRAEYRHEADEYRLVFSDLTSE